MSDALPTPNTEPAMTSPSIPENERLAARFDTGARVMPLRGADFSVEDCIAIARSLRATTPEERLHGEGPPSKIECGAWSADATRNNETRTAAEQMEGYKGPEGCGVIDWWTMMFRCTECSRWFHGACIEKHFARHGEGHPAPATAMLPVIGRVLRAHDKAVRHAKANTESEAYFAARDEFDAAITELHALASSGNSSFGVSSSSTEVGK